MAAIPRAADLPEGTVVATKPSIVPAGTQVWVKERVHHTHPWADRDGGHAGNQFIDDMLAWGRAEVLPHGYGEDRP